MQILLAISALSFLFGGYTLYQERLATRLDVTSATQAASSEAETLKKRLTSTEIEVAKMAKASSAMQAYLHNPVTDQAMLEWPAGSGSEQPNQPAHPIDALRSAEPSEPPAAINTATAESELQRAKANVAALEEKVAAINQSTMSTDQWLGLGSFGIGFFSLLITLFQLRRNEQNRHREAERHQLEMENLALENARLKKELEQMDVTTQSV